MSGVCLLRLLCFMFLCSACSVLRSCARISGWRVSTWLCGQRAVREMYAVFLVGYVFCLHMGEGFARFVSVIVIEALLCLSGCACVTCVI